MKKMNMDDITRGNNPGPTFTMSDMENHIGQVNLNNQVSDKRWDSIIKVLNSDFPLHNASPEGTCDAVKLAIDDSLNPHKSRSRWDALWVCGMVLIVISSAIVMSWVFTEVLKYLGG